MMGGRISRRLFCSGLRPRDLDGFCQNFVAPKAVGKLQERFFETRCKDLAEDGSIRVFGGELLLVVPILVQFCKRVILPAGKLQRHVQCYMLLAEILKMLLSGDKVLQHLGTMQRLIADHHVLFVELYPRHVRPKLHYLLHLPTCFQEMNANVSCFVCERRHRIVKRLAASAFRHYETVLISSVLTRQVQDITDGSHFAAAALCHPVPSADGLSAFSVLFGDGVAEVTVSTRARFGWTGLVCRGDVATLTVNAGTAVGRLEVFFCATIEGVPTFFVQADVYASVDQNTYDPSRSEPRLFEATRLMGAVLYCRTSEGHIQPCDL